MAISPGDSTTLGLRSSLRRAFLVKSETKLQTNPSSPESRDNLKTAPQRPQAKSAMSFFHIVLVGIVCAALGAACWFFAPRGKYLV